MPSHDTFEKYLNIENKEVKKDEKQSSVDNWYKDLHTGKDKKGEMPMNHNNRDSSTIAENITNSGMDSLKRNFSYKFHESVKVEVKVEVELKAKDETKEIEVKAEAKQIEGRVKIPEKPQRGLMEYVRRIDITKLATPNRFTRVENLHKRYEAASRWINEKLDAGAIPPGNNETLDSRSIHSENNETLDSRSIHSENKDAWKDHYWDDIRKQIESHKDLPSTSYTIQSSLSQIDENGISEELSESSSISSAPDKGKQDTSVQEKLQELIEDSENASKILSQSLEGREGVTFNPKTKKKRIQGEKQFRQLTEKAEVVVIDILKETNSVLYELVNGGAEDYQWLKENAVPEKYRGLRDSVYTIEDLQWKAKQKYREFGLSIMPAIREVEAQKPDQQANTPEGPALKKLRKKREKLKEYRERLINKGELPYGQGSYTDNKKDKLEAKGKKPLLDKKDY